jgi:hypothetical protein
VSVGRDLDLAQVGGEGVRPDLVGLRRPGLLAGEVLQVPGGGAVAADGGQRRLEHVLVVFQE